MEALIVFAFVLLLVFGYSLMTNGEFAEVVLKGLVGLQYAGFVLGILIPVAVLVFGH